MINPYGTNQYKRTAIVTASKSQVLIMLYEAAIRNLKKAIFHLEENDLQQKGKLIIKTHEIINELLNSLDFKIGGDIALDLERLYDFIIEQLIQSNLNNKKEPLEAIIKILETLLEGWRGAVEKLNQQSSKEMSR